MSPSLRKDYRPPDWLVPEVALDFELDPERTRVRATPARSSATATHDRPLRLAGDELEPLQRAVDGGEARWSMDGDTLVIELDGDEATVETEVEIAPAANSKLMGLYASGGMLCTQCESEGFRRITFHPDRPDVLSRYRVRMSADKARFPILLANGNLRRQRRRRRRQRIGPNGKTRSPSPAICSRWSPATSRANRDRFTTMSGPRGRSRHLGARGGPAQDRARDGQPQGGDGAGTSEVYGREYDLDLFNIVAVDDFNFGAMENKGLNIFNSRYVLADDGHRDRRRLRRHRRRRRARIFPQLVGRPGHLPRLVPAEPEGRLHRLSRPELLGRHGLGGGQADRRCPPAARRPIPGGLPGRWRIRCGPNSYIEITNFYTATVYNKGAELIRMMRTILGDEKFRAGQPTSISSATTAQAVTCEDFVTAMEDASGVDLSRFRLWYEQAGTPRVTARLDHDADARTATLHLVADHPADARASRTSSRC